MTFKLFNREISVKKEVLVLVILFLVAVTGIIGYLISRSSAQVTIQRPVEESKEYTGQTDRQTASTQTKMPENTESNGSSESEIKVYVVGCVKNPGIVTLKKGQMIDDAIKAAGGTTDNADLNNINLVYKLDDNVMLKVRAKNEPTPIPSPETVKPSGKDGGAGTDTGTGNVAGNGVEITKDSSGAIADGSDKGSKSNGKIDINTASADELDALPGIGKATAQDIVNYREKSGKFKAITDIMKIAGIKESKFNKIKDLITAQ